MSDSDAAVIRSLAEVLEEFISDAYSANRPDEFDHHPDSFADSPGGQRKLADHRYRCWFGVSNRKDYAERQRAVAELRGIFGAQTRITGEVWEAVKTLVRSGASPDAANDLGQRITNWVSTGVAFYPRRGHYRLVPWDDLDRWAWQGRDLIRVLKLHSERARSAGGQSADTVEQVSRSEAARRLGVNAGTMTRWVKENPALAVSNNKGSNVYLLRVARFASERRATQNLHEQIRDRARRAANDDAWAAERHLDASNRIRRTDRRA